MTERSFRQYFGPSARHARACIEVSFQLTDEQCDIAQFEPALASLDLKIVDHLPDTPLPRDEAVSCLAAALLSRHASWWRDHGSDDGVDNVRRGWAALAYPFPAAAHIALDAAFDLVRGGSGIPASTADKLRNLAKALKSVSEPKLWMLAAAELHGRGTATLNTQVEIYQIGEGAKGLHFHRMGNERDSFTGTLLERGKHTTVETLQQLGLPTTRGVRAATPEQAVAAIAQVGLPCVVKPVAMSRGAGVATNLRTAEHVAAAAAAAIEMSRREVMVENQVAGDDHRLMVVGGELLWAYRRIPASVVGDGEASIAALVERENLRRAAIRGGTDGYLYKIATGEALTQILATRYGVGIDHVVPQGVRIDVAGQANIARGGVLDDVTGRVHPDNRALAIKVARLFRIGTMGIDFLTPDIARSWKDVPCAIIEVNRTPAVWGMGDACIAHRTLFPQRLAGQIPTVAVIGDEDYCADQGAALAQAFGAEGLRLTAARYSDPATAFQQVATALLDPESDAIAVRCAPAYVAQHGLPLPRCDLVIVQDEARFGWLATCAPDLLRGTPSDAKLDHAVGKLARRYADPAQGGPLPVLEPIGADDDAGEFRLKVWRTHAMPRAWFWAQVGVAAPDTAGLTTHDDLLAAVRALADNGTGTLGEFAYPELIGAWFRVTFEAALAVSDKDVRMALLAATERVNAIAAMTIG
jgi:cyanophycin synthetase